MTTSFRSCGRSADPSPTLFTGRGEQSRSPALQHDGAERGGGDDGERGHHEERLALVEQGLLAAGGEGRQGERAEDRLDGGLGHVRCGHVELLARREGGGPRHQARHAQAHRQGGGHDRQEQEDERRVRDLLEVDLRAQVREEDHLGHEPGAPKLGADRGLAPLQAAAQQHAHGQGGEDRVGREPGDPEPVQRSSPRRRSLCWSMAGRITAGETAAIRKPASTATSARSKSRRRESPASAPSSATAGSRPKSAANAAIRGSPAGRAPGRPAAAAPRTPASRAPRAARATRPGGSRARSARPGRRAPSARRPAAPASAGRGRAREIPPG